MEKIIDHYGRIQYVKDAQEALFLGWHMALCTTPGCRACRLEEDDDGESQVYGT